MGISYKLENFEGPLDLLLLLIEKNKVSIYDIPIVLITQQYLDYVSRMEEENLDIVSEFLVMAATLIDIKSRMLLPVEESEEEDEEDPRAELVRRLLEYKTYKYMAMELEEREQDAMRHLFKEPTIPREVAKYEPPVDLDSLLDGLTLAKLQKIFESVMKRQEDKIDPIRAGFGKIEKEEVDMEQKTRYIEGYIGSHSKMSFRDLLQKQHSKAEVIVTFLVILEMMKTGKIDIYQAHTFDDIEITRKGTGNNGGTE